ncbi:hypothetical protein GLOIN_2v1871901 [Rhizophagus irregularis DAOM 181602=DAOM 197198]|uniref:Uncharacterized protein n=1 Tax=Rhizophagus irregularis (strain DAOM 181602 / DAOM 197198 / MUCL 43194) TaxID=747089 RepID=A0A2P4QGG2_RHIID|nr:hypothetical protein GLOIN_2v1871901 [Rhizophagus irregularis DAOM 181602=DAOM 197198]POG76724.1 hypothetical protein GLOIN_2v1871901 [Rhizophagus irregularis DAOM 181602=DAOM 197198]|eukprot:XP_025183590.1 hypothetical protein GLOIN_2v1871901 [Rhizophagus irregularis DAOM 181602=DAOM 197198]
MGRWYSQCAGNFPCGLSEAKEIAHSRGVITNISPPSSIHRPDFLNIPEHSRGLELDIYYPQYRFAIEVQGKQHEQHSELKRMCTEVLRANGEHNERRDAENAKLKATIEELKSENAEFRDRLTKVEQKQTLNDNTPNNNSSNFNLVAVPGAITVPTEEKEMDNFLLKAHKKIDDVKHQEPISSGCSLCELFHETEISATAHRLKCSSSLLDLAKLFDKASDAEYRTNKKANEEEILCWVNFGKEFMVHFKQLVTIREKRSKEMGIQLPKISHSSLIRRTQRSMKLVKIIEKIGIDKIKYLSEYGPNSISELTNDQIQEIIDNFSKNPNTELPDDHEASIIDSEGEILDD